MSLQQKSQAIQNEKKKSHILIGLLMTERSDSQIQDVRSTSRKLKVNPFGHRCAQVKSIKIPLLTNCLQELFSHIALPALLV